MGDYRARILWERAADEAFTDKRYNRAHSWLFDGGIEVPASSSPHVVPLPFSDEHAVDPEEAFVASLSSCHMLFFLSLAAAQGHVVDTYEDNAIGSMSKNENGKMFISIVTLRPRVRFAGERPDSDAVATLHHAAHESCFIANSVRSQIQCLPEFD
ncbi:OsmC family protein [Uliginosibacterium sp. H3]|uniref:OsmC family protein n=1 Tax=Uliginosibacterium silvisoli TaxID=3114758 RepID=A0ABU6K8Y3_9RHOO|nr:OsmC family protein [Uliginosibacterium sp. H3]